MTNNDFFEEFYVLCKKFGLEIQKDSMKVESEEPYKICDNIYGIPFSVRAVLLKEKNW